jgi:hypothetical protein
MAKRQGYQQLLVKWQETEASSKGVVEEVRIQDAHWVEVPDEKQD